VSEGESYCHIHEDSDWGLGRTGPIVTGALLGARFGPAGALLGAAGGYVVSELFSEEKKAVSKQPVFYSFHFGNDVFRVQQVRQMGALDGNEPVSTNDWEEVKRRGDASIQRWIDENMKYKRCVVVLVGEKTAQRPWVKYEIKKAWNDGKGLMGIHIHNLRDPKTGAGVKGSNPFDEFSLEDGRLLSRVVRCHDPGSWDAYNSIKNNIGSWVNQAIADAQRR
jgi:hypothetical protein